MHTTTNNLIVWSNLVTWAKVSCLVDSLSKFLLQSFLMPHINNRYFIIHLYK